MVAENAHQLPAFVDYFNPVLRALHKMGGAGSNQDIHDGVLVIMGLTNDEFRQPHNKDQLSTTNLAYRLDWARTFLKLYGLIENTGSAMWSLTAQGLQTKQVDPREVYSFVHNIQNARSDAKSDTAAETNTGSAAPNSELRSFDGDEAMATSKDLPPAQELLIPAIQALRELRGTARKRDISARVKELAQLSDEQTQLMYGSGRTTVYSIVINEVRRILFSHGLISFPQTGTYQLTDRGWSIEEDELAKLTQSPTRRRATRSKPDTNSANIHTIPIDELLDQPSDWRAQLTERLYSLTDSQLESFFKRIFADFGIGTIEIMHTDPKRVIEGFFTISGLFDLRICFHFALGERLLGSKEVADLRTYATSSGADRAIYLTTGKFTEVAVLEAARTLNPKVQLIDGEQLASTMKGKGMGVRSERVIVERVVIDESWFAGL